MKSLSARLTLPGRWLAPLMLVLFALTASTINYVVQARKVEAQVLEQETRRLRERLSVEQSRLSAQTSMENQALVRRLVGGMGLDLRESVENEWLCAQILAAYGLPVARCEPVQFEDVTTRLARWLALSAERAQMQQLHLTHEHLAQMLGVRRVSITLAAGELKERGLIAYQRGVLNILNLAGLQPTVSSESLKPGRLI